ncbi:MAG: class I SAM-dependent methyltransferase [Sulfuritalea sp.]|nr:class I SAM-dependent methyltransferase [Sulfuritalea sp.]
MDLSGAIRDEGFAQHNIWEHSATVRTLYRQRARDEVEEMTCAAQAAELLAPLVKPGDTLLDVGCGSGHFYHSLRKRAIPVEYHGIDATGCLIEIGQEELPRFGLPQARLATLRLEDLSGEVDHVVCINVLSNIDNFHKPLERLLKIARRSVILRESIADKASYLYVRDRFLDAGVDLGVYVNTYARAEIGEFIASRGFVVREEADRRCDGKPEMVIGFPHHWTFLVATRN